MDNSDKNMWAVNQNIKEVVFRIIDTSPCFYDFCKKYFGSKTTETIKLENEKRISSNKKLRRYHLYVVLFENKKYGIVLWDFISTHKKYAVYSNREKLDRLNAKLLNGSLVVSVDPVSSTPLTTLTPPEPTEPTTPTEQQ